eukprot:10570940-Heterocapsa_arctica.AAC.1
MEQQAQDRRSFADCVHLTGLIGMHSDYKQRHDHVGFWWSNVHYKGNLERICRKRGSSWGENDDISAQSI